jgi:hypothetical protein
VEEKWLFRGFVNFALRPRRPTEVNNNDRPRHAAMFLDFAAQISPKPANFGPFGRNLDVTIGADDQFTEHGRSSQ